MRPTLFLFLIPFALLSARADEPRGQGRYFSKTEYAPQPLPRFETTRDALPSPLYDENPLWVETYWKAWEIAFRNFHEPAPGSGFVSQFIDAAFNDNIFLWDTSFMTMFCNVAHPIVPGIASLDNFYRKQHETGEICREIRRTTGQDFPPWVNSEDTTLFSRWGWHFPNAQKPAWVEYRIRPTPEPNPRLTLDALNHPVLAWAELESYRYTGDTSRLRLVWEPLVKYYRALQTYLQQGNGLYITDWASMDNSPRNPSLDGGGTGVDITAEMVMFARQISRIAEILGKRSMWKRFEMEADQLTEWMNQQMWDKKRQFYFDVTLDGKLVPVRTIAAYWTLLAEAAPSERAQALIKELKNPRTFGRRNSVPTCAANEPGYTRSGGYWRGAVWAPTNTMVIRGLELYGENALARSIALKYLATVADVYKKTGTIWENYSPDSVSFGRNTDGTPVMKDFVGWSGIGPILYFLEYGIGLRPDAGKNQLAWAINSPKLVGCERYRFNGHVATLTAEPVKSNKKSRTITVESDGAFLLKAAYKGKVYECAVTQGRNEFEL